MGRGVRVASSADSTLHAEDLQRLADAGFWSGRLDEALTIRERAYKAYLDEEGRLAAAGMALRLSLDYLIKANLPLAGGWLAKGEDSSRTRTRRSSTVRRRWCAHNRPCWFSASSTRRSPRRSARSRSPSGSVMPTCRRSLVVHGASLVYRGELDAGLALLDEASTSALTGELTLSRPRSSTA